MNDQKNEQNNPCEGDSVTAGSIKKHGKISSGKKKLIIIIASALFLLAMVSVIIFALSNNEEDTPERTPFPPLLPSQLYDTKEEDFDIMEYDKYLDRNRLIMLNDAQSGVGTSLNEKNYNRHGEGAALLYKLIGAIIAGDSDAYNSLVDESVGHYESFTQQQLYDIKITKESQTDIEGESGDYTEYVFTLEYKIQENNGSFKNNLLSDTARPHKIVINDSTGKLLVMDIIEPNYVGD